MASDHVKYPRTFHLPWSPGRSDDDKVLSSLEGFQGELVVTAKMDGENSTIYSDGYYHARSLDSQRHPSRSFVAALAAAVGHRIPSGWRVCGENLYAQHSIAYQNLSTYFMVFSVYTETECLSWDDTLDACKDFGLTPVPVLRRGEFKIETLEGWVPNQVNGDPCEGYVVRVARSFKPEEFSSVVGKYVRAGHVTNGEHWMNGPLVVNKLK